MESKSKSNGGLKMKITVKDARELTRHLPSNSITLWTRGLWDRYPVIMYNGITIQSYGHEGKKYFVETAYDRGNEKIYLKPDAILECIK
jgi:hypothetical protein